MMDYDNWLEKEDRRYRRVYLQLVAKIWFLATVFAWLLFFFVIRRLPV